MISCPIQQCQLSLVCFNKPRCIAASTCLVTNVYQASAHTNTRAHGNCSQTTRRETRPQFIREALATGEPMEFEESGIGEECGVFGCVAAGEWPTQLEVAQVLTLGLVALQHR